MDNKKAYKEDSKYLQYVFCTETLYLVFDKMKKEDLAKCLLRVFALSLYTTTDWNAGRYDTIENSLNDFERIVRKYR